MIFLAASISQRFLSEYEYINYFRNTALNIILEDESIVSKQDEQGLNILNSDEKETPLVDMTLPNRFLPRPFMPSNA